MKSFLPSLIFSFAALLLSASAINNGLVNSPLPAGPGLTLDESFNIEQGVYVFDALCHHGPLLLLPSTANEVFGSKQYFPDHPPLARVVLGAFHQLFAWLIPGAEASAFNVPAARLGSCCAFALTVMLLTEFCRRHFGLMTAIVSALMLMLMPRVVGHSRIAAQETGTMLAWLAAVVPLATWWTTDKPPTTRQSLISGLLFGILLATKVQGILLPPIIVGWALWHFRWRAIQPLAIWGIVGVIVFFVAWPWLWSDPFGHVLQYLGKTTDRPQLFVWYLGERYADKVVPWHYPFVLTLFTLPLCVLLGLLMRTVSRRFEQIEVFLTVIAVWPLIVFALPGTPVYDGTRLFLVIMPGFALLAARGVVLFWNSDAGRSTNRVIQLTGRVTILLAAAVAIPNVFGPHALCEYNVLVGGPAGAQSVGLEADYWASGLNGDFWDTVPENSTIMVAPVSHQFQLSDIEHLVPVVRQRNIHLVSYQYDPEKQRGLTLLIHRLADLPPHLRELPDGARMIASAEYRGVVLAQLIDTTNGTWKRQRNWPSDERP